MNIWGLADLIFVFAGFLNEKITDNRCFWSLIDFENNEAGIEESGKKEVSFLKIHHKLSL